MQIPEIKQKALVSQTIWLVKHLLRVVEKGRRFPIRLHPATAGCGAARCTDAHSITVSACVCVRRCVSGWSSLRDFGTCLVVAVFLQNTVRSSDTQHIEYIIMCFAKRLDFPFSMNS